MPSSPFGATMRAPDPDALIADTALVYAEAYERIILAKASEYYARSEEIPLLLQEAKQEAYEIMNALEAVYLPNMQAATNADNEEYLVLD